MIPQRSAKRYRVRLGEEEIEVSIQDAGAQEAAGTLLVSAGGATHRVEMVEIVPGRYSFMVDARGHDLMALDAGGGTVGSGTAEPEAGFRRVSLTIDGETYVAEVGRWSASGARRRAAASASRSGEVRSPMPGLLVSVQVSEGAEVALGQPLIIMEAMKMQMEIRAPHAGTVRRVHVAPGEEISGGRLLVTLD